MSETGSSLGKETNPMDPSAIMLSPLVTKWDQTWLGVTVTLQNNSVLRYINAIIQCLTHIPTLIRQEVMNQRPDVIVVDTNLRRIYVIEVVRAEDSTDQLRRVFVRKNTKYIQLIQQLRTLFPDFRTEQQRSL